MAIKCICGREYTPRQKIKGFIQTIKGDKCCIVCADHIQMKSIEKKVFGRTL